MNADGKECNLHKTVGRDSGCNHRIGNKRAHRMGNTFEGGVMEVSVANRNDATLWRSISAGDIGLSGYSHLHFHATHQSGSDQNTPSTLWPSRASIPHSPPRTPPR